MLQHNICCLISWDMYDCMCVLSCMHVCVCVHMLAACEYLHVYAGGSRASRNLIHHPTQEESPSHTPDNTPVEWGRDVWLKPYALCMPSHCKSTHVSKVSHHHHSTRQIRFHGTGVPPGDPSSILEGKSVMTLMRPKKNALRSSQILLI